MEIWILIAAIVVLAFLRQPVLVLLGVAALFVYAVWNDGRPEYALYDVWFAVNQDVLLAIPLFVLAGAVMSAGAIAERIIAFMRELTRPIPGGLALAAVLSCAGFAAISGSAAVTLLAVGGIMYRALIECGYSKTFSIGALCAGGVLGIIIPPSIPLILYGYITQVSISQLFLAGIGPALVLIAIFSVYAVVLNRKNREGGWRPRQIVRAFGRAGFALPVPFVILGGIYTGVFTVTEAAAVAVALAVIVEVFIHRDLSFVQLKDVAVDSAKLLGSLYPILAFAFALNVFLTAEGVPQALVAQLADVISSPVEFLIAANALLLVVGMVIDVGSATLVLAPLLQPLAEAQGIHPVHFGIMMIVNLGIGYLTPPLGLNLIVAMAAFRESFGTVCKAVLPFIGLMLVGLWIIAAFPQIALFFVR
ncbi:MAG: TRAP transporter large permease [Oceanicaulis sp.]|uniref:TRAP transporter large permease n=1 Tax=Glycocaulis sp. TaxID=1969725 RepID=UPI0025C65519|nr:TRAP transporter large permease [Glycocaulis sp.]MCC5981384.1 TRAP transporter large permease [Oceanicaulis sp.]MCH8522191.1 TRAP transporter large permease [Glycocaulis sp.]